ncbi:MAG TPA: cobalamin-binding protein [Syntrophales bacterium]|nr:cobalamin-binding protein [Syntrophales bacterium]HPQ42689.1 cobalamin-binding protein [Syntrophales bacterium]
MNIRTPIAVLLVAILCIPAVGDARTYIDHIGREVSLSSPPCRIVSLAPGVTETLFALGLDKEIAGVTTFCDYPRAAASKRKIGGLINPSIEEIVSLDPDLVIGTADGNRKETVNRLEKIGLPVYVVNPGGLDEILAMISDMGEVTGRTQEAARLLDSLRKRIDRVASLTKDSPRPGVFFQIGEGAMITAGKDTVIDRLIRAAGGQNIAGDSTIRYPRFGIETLILKNPDIIIEASARDDASSIKKRWEKWENIAAVHEGNIHVIDPDLVSRPAPRIVDGLETMAGIIHPEIAW